VRKAGPFDVYDFLGSAGGFTAFLTTRELTPGRLVRHCEYTHLFSPLLRAGLKIKKCTQVHGKSVVAVTREDDGEFTADALCTNDQNLALMISVADCCPVFVCDPRTGAMGIAHSGKKGTSMNVAGELIVKMCEQYDCRIRDLFAQIGACIRPPYYELDIASAIKSQLLDAGLNLDQISDCGTNTAADIGRYYSYRMEKGHTGRMAAVLFR